MRAIILLTVAGLLPMTASAENNNFKVSFDSHKTSKLFGEFLPNKLVLNHWSKTDLGKSFNSVFKEDEKFSLNYGIGHNTQDFYQVFNFSFFTIQGFQSSWGEDWNGLLQTNFIGSVNFSNMYYSSYLFQSTNSFLLPSCTPPVPEASTWQMMFAGLGLLGFASRRRMLSNKKLHTS